MKRDCEWPIFNKTEEALDIKSLIWPPPALYFVVVGSLVPFLSKCVQRVKLELIRSLFAWMCMEGSTGSLGSRYDLEKLIMKYHCTAGLLSHWLGFSNLAAYKDKNIFLFGRI